MSPSIAAMSAVDWLINCKSAVPVCTCSKIISEALKNFTIDFWIEENLTSLSCLRVSIPEHSLMATSRCNFLLIYDC